MFCSPNTGRASEQRACVRYASPGKMFPTLGRICRLIIGAWSCRDTCLGVVAGLSWLARLLLRSRRGESVLRPRVAELYHVRFCRRCILEFLLVSAVVAAAGVRQQQYCRFERSDKPALVRLL